MACTIRTLALVAAVVLATTAPARAADRPAPKRTVITECVEDTFQTTRTCYRTECKPVVYDTFRCETTCVPVVRMRTVVKRIPEHVVECRKVCRPTWTCEERVVMKPCFTYKTVTTCVKKCVSRGHWECREVCAKPGLFDRLCKDDCEGDHCQRTRTKKVWVHCPVYVDCPVTKCVKVCTLKPVVKQVKVCHMVCKEVQVTVCRHRCVTEQVPETVMIRQVHRVPCKAVRYERVCIPYEETVWCTRLVPRMREVEVEEAVGCCTPCCRPCEPCCPRACHGLRFRQHDCCH